MDKIIQESMDSWEDHNLNEFIILPTIVAYKIYKANFSREALACKKRYKGNKTEINNCKVKYRKRALVMAKSKLASQISKCKDTKTPDKCVDKIKKQMDNYDKKIKKIKV